MSNSNSFPVRRQYPKVRFYDSTKLASTWPFRRHPRVSKFVRLRATTMDTETSITINERNTFVYLITDQLSIESGNRLQWYDIVP